MSQEQKRISLRELKEKVEEGYKIDALVEHFGINTNQMRQHLKAHHLRLKSTRGGGSIIINDLEEANENQLELPFGNLENAVEIEEERLNQSVPDIITTEGDLSSEEVFEESSEIETVNSL